MARLQAGVLTSSMAWSSRRGCSQKLSLGQPAEKRARSETTAPCLRSSFIRFRLRFFVTLLLYPSNSPFNDKGVLAISDEESRECVFVASFFDR
jgi:hypothetical protein